MSDEVLEGEALRAGVDAIGQRPTSPQTGDATASTEYTAFISYRHGDADEAAAKWLHRSLETYRVPRRLVRERGLPRRLGKIFRDDEELNASPQLGEAIEAALYRARHLIVVCSPRARMSRWINEEIRRFSQLGRNQNILTLLVDGEPGEAFPPELLALGEPLAADLRPKTRASSRQRHHLAKLRIVAALLGCDFDDLRRRDAARRRRRMGLTALALTSVTLVVAGLVHINQMRRQEQLIADSMLKANQSRLLRDAKDYYGAIQVSLDGLPDEAHGDRRPHVADTEEALLAAVLNNAVEPQAKAIFGKDVIAGNLTALSPDGRFLAFMENNLANLDVVHLYSTIDGRELRRFPAELDARGLTRDLKKLAITAASKNLVAAYGDGLVVVHPTEPAGDDTKITSSSKRFYSLQTASDGKRLLVTGDGGCEVFDTTSRMKLLDCGKSFGTLSADGRRVATWGTGPASLWDVDAGQRLRSLSEQSGTVMSAAFAPNDDRLVTGSSNGSVTFWSAVNGRPTGQGLDHKQWVTYLGFALNGRYLITGEFSHEIYGNSFTPEQELANIAEQQVLPPIIFSPNGSRFALLFGGGVVARIIDTTGTVIRRFDPAQQLRLYEWESGSELASPQLAVTSGAAFASDDTFLTLDFTDLRAWHVGGNDLTRWIPASGNRGACVSADGSTLGILYFDKVVFIKLADGSSRELQTAANFLIGGKIVTVDHSHIVSAYDCAGNTLAIWQPGAVVSRQLISQIDNAWEAIRQFGGVLTLTADNRVLMLVQPGMHIALLLELTAGKVHDLGHNQIWGQASGDGRYILTVTSDTAIELWDTAGNHLCNFAAQRKPTVIAFAPSGAHLAIGEADGALRIFDVPTCAERRSSQGKGAAITFIRYRLDDLVVIGDSAGELRVEDANGTPVAHVQFLPERSWVDDGTNGRILGFGTTGAPALWPGSQRELVSPEDSGTGPTFYGSLQPGGDVVVIRSDALRIWSGRSGRTILSLLVPPSNDENVSFSADGRTLLVNLPSQGGLRVLQLPSGQELIDLARRQLSEARKPSQRVISSPI
jgi:WD40 repeat protein